MNVAVTSHAAITPMSDHATDTAAGSRLASSAWTKRRKGKMEPTVAIQSGPPPTVSIHAGVVEPIVIVAQRATVC